MESNINHRVIREYSAVFAEKLAESFFKSKLDITGEEILTISNVQQINYFVLKILFEKWKASFNNLESPYFDYENEEVKKAGQSYMNVLSKHIKVEKNAFLELLREATYKSLLLIFSPYEYYLQEFNEQHDQKINIEELEAIRKYIKINGHLLEAYIDRLKNDGIQAVFSEDAIRIFDEVCESIKETPEDFEHYHTLYSDYVPLDLNEVYSQPDEVTEQQDEEDSESDNINEKFKSTKQTLLDTLGRERAEAIIDLHEKKPLEGIRKSITLNQRFMFENDLFNGDKDEFEMVVNYLDNCTSHEEAMDFINENYVAKKNWDLEKEEVIEFFSVINRRFPSQ